MSLKDFLRENQKENILVQYSASSRFKGENGEPVMWELRPVTYVEFEELSERCRRFVSGKAEPDLGAFRRAFSATGVVYPDLTSEELQSSYGVIGAEDLLVQLMPNSGEFMQLYEKISEISGFEKPANIRESAKN